MSNQKYVDFDDVDVSADSNLTLVIGWRVGRNLKLRRIELAQEVDAEIRKSARLALEDLAQREPEDWTPDADLAPETVLVVPVNDEYIGKSPTLGREHKGSFLDTLAQAHLLDRLVPAKIPAGEAAFYAIVLGEPDDPTVLIRRSNPQRGLKGGKLLGVLGDKLTRVTDPVFAFDDKVDLVLSGNQLYVLSQTVFAAFFRDQQHLAAKIPAWADTLKKHVDMSDQAKGALVDRAAKDTRLKTRLEAIVTRNHLEDVSTETLRSAMTQCDLDSETLINEDGVLNFDSEDVPTILKFLNEDLFSGSLTNSPFTANKKAAR